MFLIREETQALSTSSQLKWRQQLIEWGGGERAVLGSLGEGGELSPSTSCSPPWCFCSPSKAWNSPAPSLHPPSLSSLPTLFGLFCSLYATCINSYLKSIIHIRQLTRTAFVVSNFTFSSPAKSARDGLWLSSVQLGEGKMGGLLQSLNLWSTYLELCLVCATLAHIESLLEWGTSKSRWKWANGNEQHL